MSIEVLHRVLLSSLEEYSRLLEATKSLVLFSKLCNEVGIGLGLEFRFFVPCFVHRVVVCSLSTMGVLELAVLIHL